MTDEETARERALKAIARIEQTTTLTEDEKAFVHVHELIHVKCEREWADKLTRKKIDRRVINFVRDNAINVQLSDRAEFLTDFDKPYEPAQPVHLPRYVKKGRDARPSRNPFADNSVRKHKR